MNEKNLETRINNLEDKINLIFKTLASYEIDKQALIEKNQNIKPGIATKVTYDSKGLIVKGEDITTEDLPLISIDKVKGLKQELANKPSLNEIKQILPKENKKDNNIVSTYTKVSVNKNGDILSGGKLELNDIPELNIEKIKGLSEIIDSLKEINNIHIDELPVLTSTIDNTIESNNENLLIRINHIENIIATLASQTLLDSVINNLSNKANSAKELDEGEYCKVEVNKEGIVIKGSSLSINDLPTITIDNIKDLKSELNNKIDIDKLKEINELINSLLPLLNNLNKLEQIKNEINKKANQSDIDNLRNRIQSLEYFKNRTWIDFINEYQSLLERVEKLNTIP